MDENQQETMESTLNMVLDESFGDPETLLNSRAWLESALINKGATITAKGCGFGGADLSVLIEGFKFNVCIRPEL